MVDYFLTNQILIELTSPTAVYFQTNNFSPV